MNPWIIIALFTGMVAAFNRYVENRHGDGYNKRFRAPYGKGYVKRVYKYRQKRDNPENWDNYQNTRFKKRS